MSALLACARAPASPEAQRRALEVAIQRWDAAVNAGDSEALSATMSEDVELAGGNTNVKGRDAAIRALRETPPRGKLVATTLELTISGDTASRKAGLVYVGNNGVVQPNGQALESWRRLTGEWRLRRRTVTAALDPEVSITRPSTKEPVLDR